MSALAGHRNDPSDASPPFGGGSLAARIITAPIANDPAAAKAKQWLAGLTEADGTAIDSSALDIADTLFVEDSTRQ